MTPRLAGAAISANVTGGTTLAIPTPRPEIKRPMNNNGRFPEQVSAAPIKKKTLFANSVHFRPFTSDGLLPIKQPIQAPMTIKDVAREASAKENKNVNMW